MKEILLAIVGIFASATQPQFPQNEANWTVTRAWEEQSGKFVFQASTETLGIACAGRPTSVVEFPSVTYSAHVITLNGNPLQTFGDPTYRRTDSIYKAPQISCADVPEKSKITWEVHTPSAYHAKIAHFPRVIDGFSWANFFNDSLNTLAFGTLIIIGLFGFIIFYHKVPQQLAISFLLSSLFFSMYFMTASSANFMVNLGTLTIHRIGDSALWIGQIFLVHVLYQLGLIQKWIYRGYLGIVAIALLAISVGSTTDEIQNGTAFPFPFTILLFAYLFIQSVIRSLRGKDRRTATLQGIALGLYVVMGVNDILVTEGVIHGPMLFSMGVIFAVLFIALSVHEKIIDTYRERDYLRSNLEIEVEKKTNELKSTQAELVHSAKLASLGTLSAGIAHEINNSLNYVNGGMKPLERMLADPEKANPEKMKKLFATMKVGLDLTFDIIKSLRNYTGLNQAPNNDVKLKELADTVLVILRNQTKNRFEVLNSIPIDLQIYGNTVGLNQILMNLIVNACDAMTDGGKIEVSGKEDGDSVEIRVKDEGSGIPDEVRDRIFDPFFTTKEVGKGTGLGLHIVKAEVEKHGGEIEIDSVAGQGTTFIIRLPKHRREIEEKEAA